MSADQIKTSLAQLRDALGSTQSVDPELESLLRDLDGAIQRLLSGGENAPQRDEGLIARVEDAANEFTMKHPQAAGILQRLADALGQIGI
ncbi:MAG: hypothetical protein DCC68_24115 [Planctomycetota bacterium]|nr:MAG: hypothetical protein DCC68_24115 [Planctomycetota bacterium]